MSTAVREGHRSAWDVGLGVVIVLVGLVVLGNAVVATVVSIFFVGWAAVIGGFVLLVQAFVRLKSGGFWSMALGGAVLLVLGVVVLRNPAVGLVSFTLLAGALFLVAGVTRIAVSGQAAEARWTLVISGVVSALLGLVVLTNVMGASLTLLGTILGVQTVIEGVTLLVAGREPASRTTSPPRATAAPA